MREREWDEERVRERWDGSKRVYGGENNRGKEKREGPGAYR
jgi:hypothetical protein